MRRVIPAIYAIVFLDAMLQFALVPLLPDYVRQLGLTKTESGVIVGTYSALVLLAALPVGHLADRLGPRRLTIAGTALLALSTAAYGLADGFWSLALARAGQGISSAISWTAGVAWLAGAAPPDRRAAVLGSSMAMGTAGALLGPVLGGPLGQAFGIRAPFVVFAAVAAVLAAWSALLPEGRRAVSEPVSPRQLVRTAATSRLLIAGVLVMTVVATISGALQTLVPLHLGAESWSATSISVVLGVAGAVGVIANLVAARVYTEFGGVSIGLVSLFATAAAAALLVPAALPALAVAAVYVAAAPAISAQYAISFPLAADGAEQVGLPNGAVLGLMNVCWGMGFTVGPAAGAWIAERSSDGVSYALCALVCLAAMPLLRLLALSPNECQEAA